MIISEISRRIWNNLVLLLLLLLFIIIIIIFFFFNVFLKIFIIIIIIIVVVVVVVVIGHMKIIPKGSLSRMVLMSMSDRTSHYAYTTGQHYIHMIYLTNETHQNVYF